MRAFGVLLVKVQISIESGTVILVNRRESKLVVVNVSFIKSWATELVTQYTFRFRVLGCTLNIVASLVRLAHYGWSLRIRRWSWWANLRTRNTIVFLFVRSFHLLHDLSLKLLFIGLSIKASTSWTAISWTSWKWLSIDFIDVLAIFLSMLNTLFVWPIAASFLHAWGHFKTFLFTSKILVKLNMYRWLINWLKIPWIVFDKVCSSKSRLTINREHLQSWKLPSSINQPIPNTSHCLYITKAL